jgi:hypothetical protein
MLTAILNQGNRLFRRAIIPKLILSCCFLIITTAHGYSQGPTPEQKLLQKVDSIKKAGLPDSIISIKNLSTQHDSAKIKEVIAIKVYTTKNIDSLRNLYVDGKIIPGVLFLKSNDIEKTLYVQLDAKVRDTLLTFLQSNPFEKSLVPVYFGVGSKDKILAMYKAPIYVEVRQQISKLWIGSVAIVIFILAAMGLYNNILKDDNNLYYSLGRTQLFYWTLLVIGAYLAICFKTDALPDIPLSILGILGISTATTAFSKIVENKNKDGVPINHDAKSEGWFLDILSDGSSINIQRFQNVAFNIFFGVFFIQKAFTNHIMPDFDTNVLLLMGISSGAYAGLKNSEATKVQQEPAKQTGDDIPPPPPGGGGAAPVPAPAPVAPFDANPAAGEAAGGENAI